MLEEKPIDYEIKVDGVENTFEGGAVRYSKNKGRFDLIEEDVMIRLLNSIKEYETININQYDIMQTAYDGKYIEAVIKLTCYHYSDSVCDGRTTTFDTKQIFKYFCLMTSDLAIHFQKGAEKYGERNCEKGIPLWSFRDSGLRHMTQYFEGRTDEPHHISTIWNFVMADWTINNHPERCSDVIR